MSTQIQSRRGTTAQHSSFTGAAGEITVDTDKNTVVVHDGSTAGGHPLLGEGDAVPAAGGQFTGNVEIGTGIDLNTDGTASFNGSVTVAGGVTPTSGIAAYSAGQLSIRRDGGSADAVEILNGGNASANKVATIKNDGSAMFAGGTVELAPNTGIVVDDGQLDVYAATSNTSTKPFKLQTDVGGTKVEKAYITGGGSAYFSGTVVGDEETITSGAFDLATGNHWTCGAITVPAPTNATAGTSGLIRITAGPVAWNAVFKFPGGSPPAIASFPAVIPFYVQDSSNILMGNVAEGIA